MFLKPSTSAQRGASLLSVAVVGRLSGSRSWSERWTAGKALVSSFPEAARTGILGWRVGRTGHGYSKSYQYPEYNVHTRYVYHINA